MLTWFRRQRRKLFPALLSASVLCMIVTILIALTAISYFTFQFILQEKGNSRVDVLRQICDSNAVNRMNMVSVMDLVVEDMAQTLTMPATEQENAYLREKIAEEGDLLRRLGMEYTIDVVMNDKRIFSTDEDREINIRNLKNSYWYIRHYSGEVDTSWNLRFLDTDTTAGYGISYGKTLFDADGQAKGVIVVTSMQQVLFQMFQRLLSNSATVYILDQNGIILCHANQQRIGNWMANMEAFEQKYGYDSFTMVRKQGQNVMVSNYHDPDSGWTFVEEQNVQSLLLDGFKVIRNCLLMVLLGSIVAGLIAYHHVRRVTDSFASFSEEILSIRGDQLMPVTVHEEYEEMHALSVTFNDMIGRIQDLIRDVQRREREKQRQEYDFLQAQINPHFLNNTLLAAKSLIAMGQMDRAGQMLSQLVELLHIPASPEIQFVPLSEELHLIENYIAIMNCRTEKGVRFESEVPEKLLGVQVPRMILQPMVGNSFFHGFAERQQDCCIRIGAVRQGRMLRITVWDNGEGIAPERLREIASGSYSSGSAHHGIGLKNVQSRLQIIYGGRSGVIVESTPENGTAVSLRFDHFSDFKPDQAGNGWTRKE